MAKQPPPPAKDIQPTEGKTKAIAVFAGGCFWCTEAVFKEINGVSDVVSGYAGGEKETANYYAVASGKTKHAECILITYDPAKVSYGKLLQVFFATHDPTTPNRQGPDVGPQYRSAVFYADEKQKDVAKAYIEQLNKEKAFSKEVVTTLEPLEKFYVAEEYHQDFVDRNPTNPYVRQQAAPKVEKVRKAFPKQVK